MDSLIFCHGVVAAAPPIILAVLGETITERAGVINVSLDGTIILSALTGFAATWHTNSITAGFIAAAATGSCMALFVAAASQWLNISQVAVGFVLTLLCRDLAYVAGSSYVHLPAQHVAYRPIPFLKDIPALGSILFDHNLLVYFSLAMIGAVWFYFYHTRPGLLLRGLGEQPEAMKARGYRTGLLKYLYCAAGGGLVGLSGAAFSLLVKPGWARPYGIEGTGWIALAIVIFGNWQPLRASAGAFLFVMLQSLATSLQSILPEVPTQVFPTLPFPLMILVLLLVALSDSEGMSRLMNRLPESIRKPLKRMIAILMTRPPQSLGKDLLR